MTRCLFGVSFQDWVKYIGYFVQAVGGLTAITLAVYAVYLMSTTNEESKPTGASVSLIISLAVFFTSSVAGVGRLLHTGAIQASEARIKLSFGLILFLILLQLIMLFLVNVYFIVLIVILLTLQGGLLWILYVFNEEIKAGQYSSFT